MKLAFAVRLSLVGAVLLSVAQCVTLSPTQRINASQEVEVVQGSNATIECVVPIGTRSTTWMFNGIIIGQNRQLYYPQYRFIGTDRDFSLLISNISLNENGKFLCQVRKNDSRSSIVVASANFTVLVPPRSVIVPSGPVTKCVAGNRTQLTCEAHQSKPAVSLAWLHNGIELARCLPPSEDQGSASQSQLADTTCSLILVPNRANHTQEYECRAYGKSLLNPTSIVTKLDVLHPPEVELLMQPASIGLQEDMSVSITCSAQSNPPPELWEWRVNNEKEVHASGRTFVIDRLSRRHHNATISCVVYNTIDAARKSLILHVDYPPKFVHSDFVHSASVGETVTLSCIVDANPSATISWRRRKDSESSEVVELTDFGNSHIVQLEVKADSFGEYVCVATSPRFKREFETSIYVLKKSPPRVRSVPQVHAAIRSAAHLPCTVDAVPKPIVTWSRYGMPVTESSRYSISEDEFLGGLTSILTIHGVEKADFGEYNCTSMNEFGSVLHRVTLTRITETNLDLAIGGSVGAMIALICILVLGGVILHQRRNRDKVRKRRANPRNGAARSGKAGAKMQNNAKMEASECPPTEFVDPLLRDHGASQDLPSHKCVMFGNRRLFCAGGNGTGTCNGSGSMTMKREPLQSANSLHSNFEKPWLPDSVEYLHSDCDTATASASCISHPNVLADMMVSMPAGHCTHRLPVAPITALAVRHEDDAMAVAEEARDDSSRSFDSGYGPGSAMVNQQNMMAGHLHGNANHGHHCSTFGGRFGRTQAQHALPCLDSTKHLVVLPQTHTNHPYFVQHCYGLQPLECLSNSNFPSAANSESPNNGWEHDPPTSHSSSSGTGTLSRVPKHTTMMPMPMSMPFSIQSMHIAPNLQECDENENSGHESFNEVRGGSSPIDIKQSRQYASVV